MRRINSQVDRNVGNSLVTSSDAISFIFDFFANLIKINELFSFAMKKLCPFGGPVHELENQWTTGDDTRSAGQKVSAKLNSFVEVE